MREAIDEVTKVTTAWNKSNPPQLVVTAEGMVAKGGWKDFALDARAYLVPPSDGVQDFDFTGEKPDGIVIEPVLPVEASLRMAEVPDWLKGVRVHGANNCAEAML